MLTTYRRALALPGAWQFSATGFVARLPYAMEGLGIILLISSRTGSYAQAGFLAAAFAMAAAGGALLTSRLMDRLGQGRLLPPLVIANAALLVAFVTAVHFEASFAIQLVTVALAGSTQPAIGSMVRARWAYAAPDADRLRTGFAIESVVDELIFTTGPLLTTFLAFQIGLATPLIAAACFGLVGGLLLALQRSSQPAPSGRRTAKRDAGTTRRDRSALAQPGMIYVIMAGVGVGGVFGSYEVAVVAFAQEAGRSGASGLVLGVWAFGSLLAGLVFGSRHWRRPLAQQLVILTGIMALVMVPTPFVRTIPLLTVTTFIAGMAVAPSLIATFSLTERLVPAALLTEGLTWVNSGLAMGVAAGMTLCGAIVDAHGSSWAFVLPIVSAATSFAVAAIGQPVLRKASIGRPQPLPAITWVGDPMPGPTPGGIIDDPQAATTDPKTS